MPLSRVEPEMLADDFEQRVVDIEETGIAELSPSTGDMLVFDGTDWVNTNAASVPTGIPVGTITDWPMSTPPAGWFECDGSLLLKSQYAELFNVIGTSYGSSGALFFQLPDYRGRFRRTWDHGAGIDPGSRMDRGDGTSGDVVGSIQDDAFQGHWHELTNQNYINTNLGGTLGTAGGYLNPVVYAEGIITDGVHGTPRITSETRPTNINVMAIIKYTLGSEAAATTTVNMLDESVWIKDIKASGVDAGGFTQDIWQTRDLNTLENPNSYSWVSLNSGTAQITLDAGTYEIDATAPAYSINIHKAKLRNITDGSDEIIGVSMAAGALNSLYNNAVVADIFTIAASKVFEIQHYCSTTKTTNGFGIASVLGVDEVYTQVHIRKVGVEPLTGATAIKGILIGGLSKNSNNPPTLRSGSYHVYNKIIQKNSDEAITWTGNLGNTAGDINNWYYSLIGTDGDAKCHIATESQIGSSTTVSSIGYAGSTSTYNLSAAISGLASGDILAITGCTNSANDGVFAVTGGTTSAPTVTNTIGVAQAGAGGAASGWERVGDATGTDVEIYSPDPSYSDALVGYYSPFFSGYRIVGAFYFNASSAVEHIIGYKDGRKKNDNTFEAYGLAAYGSTANNVIPRFTTMSKQWGSDYTIDDSVANGLSLTANKHGMIDITFWLVGIAGGYPGVGISVNADSTDIVTSIWSVPDAKIRAQSWYQTGAGTNMPSINVSFRVSPDDVIRPHTESAGMAPAPTNRAGMAFTFTPD